MKWIALFSLLALFFTTSALAETTFITDKISVELYSSSFQRGVLVSTVKSGAIVEVLETDGDYSKIRSPDGQEGWLHNKYLSTEKPTQISYMQLMAKHKQLQDEAEQLRSRLKSSAEVEKERVVMDKVRKDLHQAKNTINTLEKQLKEKTAALDETRQQLAALQTQQAAISTQQATDHPQPSPSPADMAQAEKDTTQTVTSPPIQPNEESPSSPMHSENILEYAIALKWALTAALLSILLGSYLGYSWLDNKIRRKHGGVRIR